MASAFGDVDYTKLNRVQGALDVATNAMLRNQVAQVGAEKEQADKAIAAQASTMFSQAIAPKEAQKTTKPVATGLSAGTVDQTARSTSEGMQEASDAEVLRAAAQAGEILAKGGGPHSQAAAKRIADYLDARVKFKQLNPQKRNVKLEDVLTPDPKNPTSPGIPTEQKDVYGIIHKLQQYKDPNDETYHGGYVWTKLDTPSKAGTGVDQTPKNLEKYRGQYIDASAHLSTLTPEQKTQLEGNYQEFLNDPNFQSLKQAEVSGDEVAKKEALDKIGALVDQGMFDSQRAQRFKETARYRASVEKLQGSKDKIIGAPGGPFRFNEQTKQIEKGQWGTPVPAKAAATTGAKGKIPTGAYARSTDGKIYVTINGIGAWIPPEQYNAGMDKIEAPPEWLKAKNPAAP